MSLKVGDYAPDFYGQTADGNSISLQDFRGKYLVLYFYPKDNTPGCTKEACSLRDSYSILRERYIEVVGVSADSIESHQKFIHQYQLPFPLIADTEKKIIQAYEAWGQKNFYGKSTEGILRKTYLIGPDQKILAIIEKVDTERHAEQILEILKRIDPSLSG